MDGILHFIVIKLKDIKENVDMLFGEKSMGKKRDIVIKSPWTGTQFVNSFVNEPIEPSCEKCDESFPKCLDCEIELMDEGCYCAGKGNHLCEKCFNVIKRRTDGDD